MCMCVCMYVYVYEHVRYQRALACASGNEIRFRLFARTFTRIKSNETLGKLEIRIGFLDSSIGRIDSNVRASFKFQKLLKEESSEAGTFPAERKN